MNARELSAAVRNGLAEHLKGASVGVNVNGEEPKTTLFDDGRHGDGEAGDGIYGGTTAKLPDGDNLVEASATTAAGANASAATVLSVGPTKQ